MATVQAKRSRLAPILALLLLALAGVLWLQLGKGTASSRPSFAREAAAPGSRPAEIEATHAEPAPKVRAPAAEPVAKPFSASGKMLELRLHDVSGSRSEPWVGRLRLLRGDHVELDWEFGGTETLEIGKLAPDRYGVRADVEGYDPSEIAIDLTGSESTVGAEVCMVPTGWIGLVLKDASGRSFVDWAREWGGEPKHFLVSSLSVVVSESAPGSLPEQLHSAAKVRATFETQPGPCVPPGSMGSVFREPGKPVWVGLRYCGTALEWGFTGPEARTLTFILDPSRIASMFAELRLRVLHEETKLPAPEAKVTLLSDSSKHRRPDHGEPRIGDDGVVVFPRLVPEEYELRVELRGPGLSSENVARLAFAPGERRDLGDVFVRSAAPIRFRVVDENGGDVQGAVVQLGPYMPGADDDTIYSTHGRPRHWSPDRNGAILVPRPSFRAVARGLRMDLDPFGRGFSTSDRSGNTLIEDRAGADEVVTLVLRERSKVEFQHVTRFDRARAQVYDEVGILVASADLRSGSTSEVMLIPGNYEARIVGDGDRELARVPFRVETSATAIVLQ